MKVRARMASTAPCPQVPTAWVVCNSQSLLLGPGRRSHGKLPLTMASGPVPRPAVITAHYPPLQQGLVGGYGWWHPTWLTLPTLRTPCHTCRGFDILAQCTSGGSPQRAPWLCSPPIRQLLFGAESSPSCILALSPSFSFSLLCPVNLPGLL